MTLGRRTFLTGVSGLALGQLLTGCRTQSPPIPLHLTLLDGSIPALFPNAFRQQIRKARSESVELDLSIQTSPKALFDALRAQFVPPETDSSWFSRLPFLSQPRPQDIPHPDLMTLGDYWLPIAIQQNWIEPFDPRQWSNWAKLPDRWKSLVQRNPQGQLQGDGGLVWAAPYRWGMTLMAYRKDKFKPLGWTPQDWHDLWRPELKQQIALLDQPREVIGLALKKLGYSYNTVNLELLNQLEPELRALHQQVKLYSSSTYLQPLVLGDVWVAVGWSNEILPLLKQNPQIQAVIPRSGTALWADLWVRPKNPDRPSSASRLSDAWIDFCWQPDRAGQLSLLTQATSPIVPSLAPDQLPKGLHQNSLLLPDGETLKRSEFLEPIPPTTIAQYRTLWQTIRSQPSQP